MKILAVIPARAGSKGIPNKNIRLIDGKPLIYYSIMNAINSRFITNIVVTTDSQEIATIANQMGVDVIDRDPRLATDEVTLDSVIYDASKLYDVDYVITLQPTSPLLTPITLDKAIEFSLANDIDTLISVINSPHLSWIEKDGDVIPAYKKRLNRQYLPPHFFETGAFVIAKKGIVTSETRIGENVKVFEIPHEESLDIDTFSDLIIAKSIINSKKIAFYVNGNNKRGMGHIYRVLELADEFSHKPDIYFNEQETDINYFGETTHKLIPVNGIKELTVKLSASNYSILINDVLNTTRDYITQLRESCPKLKIVNFEDDGEGTLYTDLVINALYKDPSCKHMYAGEKYYVSSKMFMFFDSINIDSEVKTIFISFGGADPQNYTDRILKIVTNEKKYNKFNFKVVLGRAKDNINMLLEYNNYDNIEVLYNIENMPEIMSKCDIAITSRGRTGYELAILGIPTIAMAQNTREEKHGFVCNENGFIYLGLNPNDDYIKNNIDYLILSSKSQREVMHSKLLSHDLRHGRKRVINLINNL